MSDEPQEVEEALEVPAQTLTVYVVRNQEGKFFRAKGYGGYGNSWVDDIQQARIYPKIGPARAQVTFWSKPQWAEYGVPEILVISGEVVEVLKEDDRVQKSKDAKKRRRDNSQRRHLERQRADLERRLRELG